MHIIRNTYKKKYVIIKIKCIQNDGFIWLNVLALQFHAIMQLAS